MTPTPDNPGRHLAGGLRIALRLPTYLYRWHLGWLLGQRFLLPYHANEIRPRRRRVATSGAAVLILLVATSCGTSTSTNSMASTPAQHTSNTDRVNSAYLAQVNGTIVVTSSGDPLYVFAPDKQRAVTCTGACASVWPPLTVAPGTSPTAGPGVDPKFLGVDDNPAGGQVITYNGWPLYTYVTDAKLGTRSAVATGQGLDLNGGYWYVMLTNGSPVVRPVPPKS